MRPGLVLLLAALPLASCGRPPAAPAASSARPEPVRPTVVATVVATADFTLPVPADYDDRSAEVRTYAPQYLVALVARTPRMGAQPTIVVQAAPIAGGSFADPATCAQTGRGLITGGTDSPGIDGTLERAAIIVGPAGETCQIEVRGPAGIALITELHRPGNRPSTPQKIWLMTCNHADGDDQAEADCRATLAGFRFTR